MSWDDITVGDSVRRAGENEPVMTVYDFRREGAVAMCNWVLGTRMFKREVPTHELVFLARGPDIPLLRGGL